MSTNSSIIVQHPVSKVYASVSCHWDGYLEYNGILLQRCYTTLEQAIALISLGDISSLTDSYDTTLSYYRWRKDPIRIDVSSVLADHADYEYNYLFRDGEWYVKYNDKDWQQLSLLVADMPMPRVSSSIGQDWDGKVRYFPPNFSNGLLEGWSTI